MAEIEEKAQLPQTTEKTAIDAPEVDEALNFLRQEGETYTFTAEDEKKLVRKIDWMIMPLMWSCYFLQYLDKTLINYANVMGLQGDTGTTATQFSYLALVFYITYLVFELPQGWGMQRFPTAKYLGCNVILWGFVHCSRLSVA
jgi:sugar phosphate permease